MKFLIKTDIIIIFIILVISIISFLTFNYLAQNEGAQAEIYLGSELVKTVDLSIGTDKTFSIPGREKVVFHIFEDGSIAFESSDCQDQICVHSGKLHTVGQSAACLPNDLIIKIIPKQRNNKQNDVVI
jgi:hypothetical protein